MNILFFFIDFYSLLTDYYIIKLWIKIYCRNELGQPSLRIFSTSEFSEKPSRENGLQLPNPLLACVLVTCLYTGKQIRQNITWTYSAVLGLVRLRF